MLFFKQVTAEHFKDNTNPGPKSQVLAGIDEGRKVQVKKLQNMANELLEK